MYTTLGVRHLLLKLLLIKILYLHIDCGLSSSPIGIGFCHCLQVITEMYSCSAWYRPQCETSRYVEEGEAEVWRR